MPLLHWLTRDQDIQTAAKVPHRILQEVPELSYGEPSQNLLVQGDNLEALKALLPFYAGQVKCIYIDPPYNTGAIFEHYDDALEHTQWLGNMYPRLQLMRDLLSLDGYLAVQIDDKQFARLHVLMCEIFGERNVKPIVVKMSEASGLKMGSVRRSGRIPKLKEYILIAKMDGVRNLRLDPVPKGKWDTEYNIFLENFTRDDKLRIDEILENEVIGDEHIAELDQIASKISLSSVAEKVRPLSLTGKAKEAWLFENAYRICQCATSASVLALAKEKYPGDSPSVFAVKSRRGETAYLVRGNYSKDSSKPRIQLIFAEDNLATHPGDLWLDIRTTGLEAEGGVSFKNGKKPEQLVRRVIALATSDGDIVLDCYAGSGTTAAVAHKMKRQWIGIERGEQARTHCVPRLQNVVDGRDFIGITPVEDWKGGGGFRFCTLGPTIFDEQGRINPEIKFPELARHLWFVETKTPMASETVGTIIGSTEKLAYALLYNGILKDRTPNGGNVLTSGTLKIIREDLEKAHPGFEGEVVVYAAASRIGPDRLRDERIIFKQTPYDISARG